MDILIFVAILLGAGYWFYGEGKRKGSKGAYAAGRARGRREGRRRRKRS